ncbi:rhodanese-like domain-containing protein [Coraliomargarita sp. W4R53]
MNLLYWISLSALLLSGCHNASTPEAELETMIQEVSTKFNEVPQVPTSELAEWLADPTHVAPILLDVREPDEYAVSHLPGAIQVSPDATAQQLIDQIDFTRPIMVYCSVGYRSSMLARRLIASGATETMNLEGSIFKWANEGRPMLKESGATDKAHPYNRKFGRMLQESLRAYR